MPSYEGSHLILRRFHVKCGGEHITAIREEGEEHEDAKPARQAVNQRRAPGKNTAEHAKLHFTVGIIEFSVWSCCLLGSSFC